MNSKIKLFFTVFILFYFSLSTQCHGAKESGDGSITQREQRMTSTGSIRQVEQQPDGTMSIRPAEQQPAGNISIRPTEQVAGTTSIIHQQTGTEMIRPNYVRHHKEDPLIAGGSIRPQQKMSPSYDAAPANRFGQIMANMKSRTSSSAHGIYGPTAQQNGSIRPSISSSNSIRIQPSSSTIIKSSGSNTVLEKMDKLCEEIVPKLITFYSNEKLFKEMGEHFINAMFKKEFPSEVVKTKVEVEKYLERKITFEQIFKIINEWKLEASKLKALKELQNKLNLKLEELKQQKKNTFGKLENFITNSFGSHENLIEKQLELVNLLINTHEIVNKYVEDISMELQIRQPVKGFLQKLQYHINEQRGQFEMPYSNFVSKYSDKYFPEIENIIKIEKEKLQNFYNEIIPKSHNVETNLNRLHGAIFNPEPFLEKVALNIKPQSPHFVRILSEKLNNAVDELPNKIEGLFENNKKQEFAKLNFEFFDLQLLIIACDRMLGHIQLITIFKNLINQSTGNENWINKNLIYIHCMTEYIREKFEKMNIVTHCLIPNMAKANEMGEYPNELEIKEEMEPKTKVILIAQNMLFLAAQLGKFYNFRDAIDTINKSKDAIIHELILKYMPSKGIGQFFYEKYTNDKLVEMMAKGEYQSAGKS